MARRADRAAVVELLEELWSQQQGAIEDLMFS
jgi:hypothetical protein